MCNIHIGARDNRAMPSADVHCRHLDDALLREIAGKGGVKRYPAQRRS